MLSGVVGGLVADGWRTAVVARSKAALRALVGRTARPAEVLALPSDYSDPERFRAALSRARHEVGPFRLAVLWVHSPSRDVALPIVAEALADDAVVVDVRSSAAADPTREQPPPPSVLAAAPRGQAPDVGGDVLTRHRPRYSQVIADQVVAVVHLVLD
jgi:NAD(P)-dependent dehydrogenase (short-subunit alcohol dehydrogenase family)